MRVRRAESADHRAALEVYRAAQAFRGRRPSKDRLTRVAEKLATELVVVADDDGVIGLAVAEPARARDGLGAPILGVLHVSMVFVAPERQRSGVGAALLDGLADVAWVEGYRSLTVWTATPEFYLACGLEPTGRHRRLPDGRDVVQLTAVLEPPAVDVVVGGGEIRLGQLLKLAGLVDTGSEAKQLLADGAVSVNDEVDRRRGRQLVEGDQVRLGDRLVRVSFGQTT